MNLQLAHPQSSHRDYGRRSGRFCQACAFVCLAWGLLTGGVLSAQDTSSNSVPVEAADDPAATALGAAAPVDPNAAKVGRISTNVLDMMDALGIWNIPFAIASVIFLWFTGNRAFVLHADLKSLVLFHLSIFQ